MRDTIGGSWVVTPTVDGFRLAAVLCMQGGRLRVALGLAAAGVLAGSCLAVGPRILRGCVPIPPRELPSGSQPGRGIEGVSAGAKQGVWGSGPDRVEQIVGLSLFSLDSTTLASVAMHGYPAKLYRVGDPGSDLDLAITV
jgi:hypothetical protein